MKHFLPSCVLRINARRNFMAVLYMQTVENLLARQALKKNSPIEKKYRKIKLEWEKFITGERNIDTAIVPEEILNAWHRYREMDLDPLSKPQHNIVKGKDLEKLLVDNKELIDISRPFLNNLYQLFVKHSGFSISLFNHQGFILDVRHDDQYREINQFLHWFPGVQWLEEIAANNIISLTLGEKKPCQIFGPHHYKKRYHNITCSGAPIINPEGTVIGGIIIAALYYGSNPHTLGMAAAAAHAIENGLRIQKALLENRAAFRETDIAYSLQKAILTAIPEALIAIDSRGHISLINEQARKKFFLKQEEVEGQLIDDAYSSLENSHFLNLINKNVSFNDAEVRIFSKNGSNDCLLTCKPIISSSGKTIGKILIFSEITRIKSLVTKMIGAKAKFRFEDICGKSPRFLMTLQQARVAAQSSSNVLLLGESGTGKDIFAQAIHNASTRKNSPYVAINCAAIPRDLITSELFGYSDGAFTGSRRGGNQGRIELAEGGTIFLDEIAETPLELQAVLLRVIEDKSVIRIGGSRIRSVDVRIIVATNKNLLEEVRKGNFRKDLYYRLNVFTIQMLPLTERLDDIPLLVEMFIKKYAATAGKKINRIDERILEIFMQHSWPGNVRELQNIVERMINFAPSDELTADLIPPEIMDARNMPQSEIDLESPDDAERKLISRMLSLNFRKNRIAEQLNISRTTLFRKINKYKLNNFAQS
jgi:sigma-54 dependent transcriptional regulator, acetoin dehydrogenase operon transcriptional activator AcoR